MPDVSDEAMTVCFTCTKYKCNDCSAQSSFAAAVHLQLALSDLLANLDDLGDPADFSGASLSLSRVPLTCLLSFYCSLVAFFPRIAPAVCLFSNVSHESYWLILNWLAGSFFLYFSAFCRLCAKWHAPCSRAHNYLNWNYGTELLLELENFYGNTHTKYTPIAHIGITYVYVTRIRVCMYTVYRYIMCTVL